MKFRNYFPALEVLGELEPPPAAPAPGTAPAPPGATPPPWFGLEAAAFLEPVSVEAYLDPGVVPSLALSTVKLGVSLSPVVVNLRAVSPAVLA